MDKIDKYKGVGVIDPSSLIGRLYGSQIKIGNKQAVETLISEEALLFAKFLRDKMKEWQPRIGISN